MSLLHTNGCPALSLTLMRCISSFVEAGVIPRDMREMTGKDMPRSLVCYQSLARAHSELARGVLFVVSYVGTHSFRNAFFSPFRTKMRILHVEVLVLMISSWNSFMSIVGVFMPASVRICEQSSRGYSSHTVAA